MVSVIKPELCIRCKGRLWCGLKKCPLLEARRIVGSLRLDRDISGYSPPSILVGWGGYPNVSVMPVLTLDDPVRADNPRLWVESGASIDDILSIRMRMGGGFRRTSVREPPLTVQEIAMSRRPVASDVELRKPPRPTPSFSNLFPPIGFREEMLRISLAENPKVDKRVESIYYDEIKARDAVIYLYERGYDVYDITRFLSAGVLGIEKKMVPTRWSITAVDSMVSEHLLSEVTRYPTLNNVLLFFSNLYDNYFYIFFIPGPWAFELVEAWAPMSFWASGKKIIISDSEVGRSRDRYASNVGGSYYATKIAVLEKLREIKALASVLVLREVREGYYAPLGVWQVRENVRNALRSRPLSFNTLNEALTYAREHLGMRIRPEEWKEKSVLLRGVQTRLF